MLPAFFTTVLFSFSAVFANRTSSILGGTRANFFRLVVATLCLAVWAHAFGGGLGGGALSIFFVSGCVGFGIGDLALYQALPRIGSRLTILFVQCLAAPIATLIEWAWLGTHLKATQIFAGIVILGGVLLAIAPGETLHIARRRLIEGVIYGVIAAFGQGMGAVLTRKAYDVIHQAGGTLDGGTAAYQRILGGILVGSIPLFFLKPRQDPATAANTPSPWRKATPWILANSLTGPVLGVACYQWALATTPSGIVLPIVATTPLVVIPLTYHLEGDRPGPRALIGGVCAVLGVILMVKASAV
jgi:drug/metabolite transporter (DMT)-like permease